MKSVSRAVDSETGTHSQTKALSPLLVGCSDNVVPSTPPTPPPPPSPPPATSSSKVEEKNWQNDRSLINPSMTSSNDKTRSPSDRSYNLHKVNSRGVRFSLVT